MAGYYSTDCDVEIPAHNCDPCETKEYGRIRSFGFIHKDFVFANDDTTDPTEWQRGVSEGKIIIVNESNGELAEPSEKTGTGYGDTPVSVTGFDYELTVTDPNFVSNCDHYSGLVRSRRFKVFFRTSSQTYISPVTATIIPKFQIPNDLNTEVVWATKIQFSTTLAAPYPCPFNTPEGVFDSCFIAGV